MQKTKEKIEESNGKDLSIDEKLVETKTYYEAQIDTLLEKRVKGSIIRSKSKWYEEGEKASSKYFFNLEKVRYSNKMIKKLITEDNTVVREQKDIIAEQYKFYKKLYTSDPKIYFMYTNNENIKLDDVEKNQLDSRLTLQEVTQAIRQMKSDSSPGPDGLTAAFYKVFWSRVKDLVFNAIIYAIDVKKQLHYSARCGILSLIPKPNRSPELLTNWRPLTLQNCDHKILAKTLANRLKPFLSKLIDETQTGYIEGRFIGLNLRRLIDLLYMVEKENLDAMLISVDFYKAFDTIEFSAVIGALKYFNIGDYFIRMIETLYNGFITKIMHNGEFSKYMTPTRGIHQGCAVSGYLFVLAVEILSHQIKNNAKIKGIPIPNTEDRELLSQFVDDLTVASMFDETSLQEIVKELETIL